VSLCVDVCAVSCISCGPKGQVSIQLAHSRIERRAMISPVVEEPASNDWIKHPGQIFDRLITALWQFPASNRCPNGRGRLCSNRRTEIDEVLPSKKTPGRGKSRVNWGIKREVENSRHHI